MTRNDFIAQGLLFAVVTLCFLRLLYEGEARYRFFIGFSGVQVIGAWVWLAQLWEIWAWVFPGLALAACLASIEGSWNMTSRMAWREALFSRLSNLLIGATLAKLCWILGPRFPGFSSVSLRWSVTLFAFAAGCCISAGTYWLAHRDPEMRHPLRLISLVGLYAAVQISCCMAGGHFNQMPEWHYCVEASCLIRSVIQVAATMTLVRAQRLFLAAA